MKSNGFGESNSPENSSVLKIPHKKVRKWYDKAKNGDVRSAIKYQNYMRCLWNEDSTREGSKLIHERDYEPMECCICGAEMNSIHDTANPEPVTIRCTAKDSLEQDLPYRCCKDCDQVIILPLRIEMMKRGEEWRETGTSKISKEELSKMPSHFYSIERIEEEN